VTKLRHKTAQVVELKSELGLQGPSMRWIDKLVLMRIWEITLAAEFSPTALVGWSWWKSVKKAHGLKLLKLTHDEPLS
jgi:hypothetical protein